MEFLGLITTLVITGLAGALVKGVAADPNFVAAIAAYSPWIAEHSMGLGWMAVALICVGGVAIPPLLLKRESLDGSNQLAEVGNAVSFVCIGYAFLFLAIPGVAYLLGMGWFAARKASGF